MGKKANVGSNNITVKERRKDDFYPTPRKAVEPLLPHLFEYGNFIEPCAGAGDLVKHIESMTDYGVVCRYACDVTPRASLVEQRSALSLTDADVVGVDLIITNPPFQWEMLKPILDHLPTLKPTWLLLPFSYACNKRMGVYMQMCKKVVPIGRVKWIEDSKQSSTDDFAWFLFDSDFIGTTKLYARK